MSDTDELKKIVLPASFTEKTIDGVLETIKECTDAGLDFEIDGSEVERVDSAALQALVFFLMPADGQAPESFDFLASDLLAKACKTAGVVRAQAA